MPAKRYGGTIIDGLGVTHMFADEHKKCDRTQVSPSLYDWYVARQVHARFASRPGAQHIASLYALAHLAALIRLNPSPAVFEFGAGIGTMTYLLLALPPPTRLVTCVESDPFCQEQLKANIPDEFWPRLTVLPGKDHEPNRIYDLVVVDGGFAPSTVDGLLREGTVWFVEGTRNRMRRFIQELAATKYLSFNLTRQRVWWAFKFRWRMTRFGFLRPCLSSHKTCWIGMARKQPDAASLGHHIENRPTLL